MFKLNGMLSKLVLTGSSSNKKLMYWQIMSNLWGLILPHISGTQIVINILGENDIHLLKQYKNGPFFKSR